MKSAPLRAVALAVVLALASACSAGPPTSGGFVAGDGSIVLLDRADRSAAPAVVGSDFDGRPFRLADHLGTVVVLNVWASWCAPCRAEAPVLEAAWREFGPKGALFVGLDTRDSDAAAQAFIERFGITYPNVVDRDGGIQLLFSDTLPPQAIPSTVFIDKQGQVAARILGRASESDLRGVLEPLLAEQAAP
jgi:thiol-disulfide isomerase/thioredoxin